MAAPALALLSILVWSTLAVLGSRPGHLSPYLSVGVALTLGGLVGLVRFRDWRVPLRTFALGVGGIFGYHTLLFAAFRRAPAVEVNLLRFLWPVLIVAGAVVGSLDLFRSPPEPSLAHTATARRARSWR